MEKYSILTYGRLSQEFADFANKFEGITCTAYSDKEEVKKDLPHYNAIAGFDFLKGLDISHIKWLHCFVAGVDSYFSSNTIREEMLMSRTSGNMGRKIGEYCLAYILHHLKSVKAVSLRQSSMSWQQLDLPNLFNKTILIFGTGSIGRGIAQVLTPLAKNVVGVNRTGKANTVFNEIISFKNLQNTLLDEFDIVINALPLTRETTYFFNKDIFQKFQSILFLNIGRGKSVDVPNLLSAIEENYISYAVLDVFEEEPLPAKSPLWLHPKIIVTPHHSGVTTLDDVKESFAEVYEAIKLGKPSRLFVNTAQGY